MSVDLLTEDDFWDDIHGVHEVGERLSIEDTRLTKEVPIVISYELADMTDTDYHFRQEFKLEDTRAYFGAMKNISCHSINELIDESEHSFHFYRSMVNQRMKELLLKLDPKAQPDYESTFIYHFALYTDPDGASRETGKRSPRIYFMLGRYGMIFPLFFDPYHEINPDLREKRQ